MEVVYVFIKKEKIVVKNVMVLEYAYIKNENISVLNVLL
jgi:hypothetical protein|tara:strand:- start:74 stop:190 length:117 start_codon:yes stop_codon:yes gene_type:complete